MSVSMLKWIAFLFMVIDHIGYFFPTCKYYVFFRMIGRMSAPIFFFCFVEGYTHTSNKQKYKERLCISAISMGIINLIMIWIFAGLNNPLPKSISFFQPNVIFTMFIMFLILEGIDNKQYWKLCFIILVPFLEYSIYAFNTILIFRYVKNKWVKFSLFIITNSMIAMITHYYIEIFMIGSIIYLISYNGEKGKWNTKLFYPLYPLHFYLIKLISIL